MRKMTIEERIKELESDVRDLKELVKAWDDVVTSSINTKPFSAEIKLDDMAVKEDLFGNPLLWLSKDEIKKRKHEAAKHTQLKPCPCGLYPEIYCDCEKRDKGDVWTYEIYCANEDCDCYLRCIKMLKTDEDPFELEEEVRKEWNKMAEGKLED